MAKDLDDDLDPVFPQPGAGTLKSLVFIKNSLSPMQQHQDSLRGVCVEAEAAVPLSDYVGFSAQAFAIPRHQLFKLIISKQPFLLTRMF